MKISLLFHFFASYETKLRQNAVGLMNLTQEQHVDVECQFAKYQGIPSRLQLFQLETCQPESRRRNAPLHLH